MKTLYLSCRRISLTVLLLYAADCFAILTLTVTISYRVRYIHPPLVKQKSLVA
jgi:hypothetical protein